MKNEHEENWKVVKYCSGFLWRFHGQLKNKNDFMLAISYDMPMKYTIYLTIFRCYRKTLKI